MKSRSTRRAWGEKQARRIVAAKIALTVVIALSGAFIVYTMDSRAADALGLAIVALSPIISYIVIVALATRLLQG